MGELQLTADPTSDARRACERAREPQDRRCDDKPTDRVVAVLPYDERTGHTDGETDDQVGDGPASAAGALCAHIDDAESRDEAAGRVGPACRG